MRELTRTELLQALKKSTHDRDTESAHTDADEALLRYINDAEITEAYEAVPKWYA